MILKLIVHPFVPCRRLDHDRRAQNGEKRNTLVGKFEKLVRRFPNRDGQFKLCGVEFLHSKKRRKARRKVVLKISVGQFGCNRTRYLKLTTPLRATGWPERRSTVFWQSRDNVCHLLIVSQFQRNC